MVSLVLKGYWPVYERMNKRPFWKIMAFVRFNLTSNVPREILSYFL